MRKSDIIALCCLSVLSFGICTVFYQDKLAVQKQLDAAHADYTALKQEHDYLGVPLTPEEQTKAASLGFSIDVRGGKAYITNWQRLRVHEDDWQGSRVHENALVSKDREFIVSYNFQSKGCTGSADVALIKHDGKFFSRTELNAAARKNLKDPAAQIVIVAVLELNQVDAQTYDAAHAK